jgi:hypothetical protein
MVRKFLYKCTLLLFYSVFQLELNFFLHYLVDRHPFEMINVDLGQFGVEFGGNLLHEAVFELLLFKGF